MKTLNVHQHHQAEIPDLMLILWTILKTNSCWSRSSALANLLACGTTWYSGMPPVRRGPDPSPSLMTYCSLLSAFNGNNQCLEP